MPKITYFEKDLDFSFSHNSSKITIVPGSAKHINIDQKRLSNFNYFGAPLYPQPCVEVTDSMSNPVAPNLQVQAYLCAGNGTTSCQLAGIAETGNSKETCFSGLEIDKKRQPSDMDVAYFYFTFLAADANATSPFFRVYDLAGLQMSVEPTTSIPGLAINPPPEVWLCFGHVPCGTANRILQWPHGISADLLDARGERVPESFPDVFISGGSAKFESLILLTPGNDFSFSFALGGCGMTVKSQKFSVVADDVVRLKVSSIPRAVRAGQRFNASVNLSDFLGQPVLSNRSLSVAIDWAKECTSCAGNTLFGVTNVISQDGEARFHDLYIEKVGIFALEFFSPSSRVLDVAVSGSISVLNSQVYRLKILRYPPSGEYGRVLFPSPRLHVVDQFDNAVIDLDGRPEWTKLHANFFHVHL